MGRNGDKDLNEGYWKSGWGDMARKVPLGSVGLRPYNLNRLESRNASFAKCSMKFWFPLYLFSFAAVTNCQTCSGLKQHKIVFLQFWEAEVQNGSHWAKARYEQSWVPSEGSRGSIFKLLEATCIPFCLAPFFHLKAHHSNFCFCGPSLFLSDTPMSPP